MRGSVPSLPQYVFMGWCLINHKYNFTFTLPELKIWISLSKTGMVLEHKTTGITGSDSSRRMEACLSFDIVLRGQKNIAYEES
jgi:hypothetical protein